MTSYMQQLKNTMAIRSWGLRKVPLIYFIGPKVYDLTPQKCSVGIPLKWLNKNHYNSLYLSAQVTGAELAVGLLADHHIRKDKAKIALLFKDMKAQFLKRPDAETVFTCTQGADIARLIANARQSNQRQNQAFNVVAKCPSKDKDTIVCEFELTLSIKSKA